MKKMIAILMSIVLLTVLLAGCTAGSSASSGASSGGSKNIEGKTEDILKRVYEGIDKSIQLPHLEYIVLSEDMGSNGVGAPIEYYLGVKGLPFSEGTVSEAAIGAVPYSVCLIRLNAGADVEKVKNDIKSNANPAKWICVAADTVIVDNNGDLVILIMTNESSLPGAAKAIQDSFKKLT